MNRFLLVIAIFCLVSCHTDTELFDEVCEIAQFDRVYEPSLIQSGKESGSLEPLMEYSIFKIDRLAFNNLENSIMASEKFNEGRFYFNIELSDYLNENNLEILNLSKSLITENQYDKIYHLYLLSDRETFAVCKVYH